MSDIPGPNGELLCPPFVYSPVLHRYSLATRHVDTDCERLLDVGGYPSRRRHIERLSSKPDYFSANIGPAWYGERPHVLADGLSLPFRSGSFHTVISVDSLEHVPRGARARFIAEMVRVAARKAVIVVPFHDQGVTNERVLLDYSRKFQIEPMPSLVEHEKYGLPTVDQLQKYTAHYRAKFHFATPKDLYWRFQITMLLNTAVLRGEAELLNMRLQRKMEEILLAENPAINRADAYRVVMVIHK